MSRAWTMEEKQRLEQSLLREAQGLFERLGLQKTTVDDIVRAVGISKGAFYRFYESKEELFFDLLERAEERVRADLGAFRWDEAAPADANLARFFRQVVELLSQVPFLRTLSGTERQQLQMRLPPERLARHQQDDEEAVIRLFQAWAAAGKIRAVDWKALTLVVQDFVLVLTRQPPGGATPEVDLWIEMLCRLLAPDQEECHG